MAIAGIRVRHARLKDVSDLTDRNRRLIGEPYRWFDRLGEGRRREDHGHLGLVAVDEPSGQIVGQLGMSLAGKPTRREQPLKCPRGVELPWRALNSIAVEPSHQGRGIGRMLLATAVDALPSKVIGIYGDVAEDNVTTIDWYRRLGFHTDFVSRLIDDHGQDCGAVMQEDDDNYASFAGRISDIRQRLAADDDGESFVPAAVVDEFELVRSQLGEVSVEPATVRFAHMLLAASDSCPHMAWGPRPGYIQAWQPAPSRRCGWCQLVAERSPNDPAEDLRCDGCGDLGRQEPHTFSALLKDQRTVVRAGFCPTCRAGGMPPEPFAITRWREPKPPSPRSMLGRLLRRRGHDTR